MNLKTKIVSTIMSMVLALGCMGISVWAASTQTLTISNTVSFVSNHVLATVTGVVTGAVENSFVNYESTTTTADDDDGKLGTWAIGNSMQFEDQDDMINIAITIVNNSKQRWFTFELSDQAYSAFSKANLDNTNIDRMVVYSVTNTPAIPETVYTTQAVIVQPEQTATIEIRLSISDTGKSVTNFNNSFKLTLINEGTPRDGLPPAYSRSNETTVLFGSYPQTIASASAVLQMGTVADENGYFTSAFDDAKYEKVVATPHYLGGKFSNLANVLSGTTYYFKVEPISWRILSENGTSAFLLSNFSMDARAFDADSNDWETSAIREWLNQSFYEKAFSELQQELIISSMLNNSSTGGIYNNPAANDTQDKVFLLSYDDAVQPLYGFDATYSVQQAERLVTSTDFARARGIWVGTGDPYGASYWWLRTPGSNASRTSSIYGSGSVYRDGIYVDEVDNGVRMALYLTL